MDGLNEEQRAAVETTEGYVRVVAGAGSGKTRALAHRFAYLVQTLGVMPGHILCVTFSNKSANEMRTRIRNLTGDSDTGLVNTFHGFCAAVLREDGHAIQYPKNFPVLDNADIDTILKAIYEERGLTLRDMTFARARDMFEIRKTIAEPGYCRDLVSLSLDDLKAKYDAATSVEDILFRGYLYRAKRCFALDYNDLIMLTLRIYDEFPDIRRKWQERLEYVMIDEYQDIDPLQYKLMKVLAAHHKNLFVVGDPDQTIYTWRGANVKYLLDFERDFSPARTILMTKNYRSSPEILAVVNSLIAKNAERVRKDLVPVRPRGPRVLCHPASRPDEEANWIAKKMGELHAAGTPYAQMAVLYRAHYVTREVEGALQRAEIPYTIYSGVQFYDRTEVKDALSYLRLVFCRDDLSFARVANVPKRNLGARRMAFLRERADENRGTLLEALRASVRDPLFKGTGAQELLDLVDRHQKTAEPVSETLAALLDESGYEKMLRTEGAQARLDNLAELKRSVSDWEEACGEECAIGDYLSHVALYTNRDMDGAADRVKLMTVHTAKGLEFPYVFLCALNEGIFPSRKTETREQMEEERRLAFVAMTRAERALFLSSSGGRNFDGSPRYPSRFLLDIEPELFDYTVPPRKDLVEAVRRKAAFDALRPGGETGPSARFAVGARVRHTVFGAGTVVAVDTDKRAYEIRFDTLATNRTLSFGCALLPMDDSAGDPS